MGVNRVRQGLVFIRVAGRSWSRAPLQIDQNKQANEQLALAA